MLDWNFNVAVKEVGDLLSRVNSLVQSLSDLRHVKGVALVAGSQKIAHGGRSIPRQVKVIVAGDTASTAIVTRGAMDRFYVTLHATADCTVDLEVTDGAV